MRIVDVNPHCPDKKKLHLQQQMHLFLTSVFVTLCLYKTPMTSNRHRVYRVRFTSVRSQGCFSLPCSTRKVIVVCVKKNTAVTRLSLSNANAKVDNITLKTPSQQAAVLVLIQSLSDID